MVKGKRGGKRSSVRTREPAREPASPFEGRGLSKLEQLGGSRWTKYGRDRLYLRRMYKEMGLELTYHNSGNIRSAKLDGEDISNSEARRILGALDESYIDIQNKKLVLGGREEHQELIKKKVYELANRS